jgi:AAA+ ATPase superfamily predicted ATPase
MVAKKNETLNNNIFIDRTVELAMLVTGLKGVKDYVLIAPRRFGKTTLMNKVFEVLSKEPDYILLSIDIMRYSGSVRRLAEGITELCLDALGFRGKLQFLLKQVSLSLQLKLSFGDLEIEPILNLLKTRADDGALLGHALELFEQVALKTKKTVIIFFDEFGELHGLGDDVIKIFRSVLQVQKHCCCVFAGSQETLMSKIFVEKNSAFFRFGEIINLGSLNLQEVISFLSSKNFDLNVVQNILTLFEGHPYYTGRIIRDLLIEPHYGASNVDFFRYLQERLLTQEAAYLEMVMQNIKSRAGALTILTNLAINLPTNSGLEGKSRQTIYALLKNLEIGGHVRKVSGAYKLVDPLLKLYLAQ